MTLQSKDFAVLNDWDNQHFMHPWESVANLGENQRPFVEGAKGIYVYDENGRQYIDGPGGMWCMQIGYGRSEMGAAMAAQVEQLGYYSPFYHSNSTTVQLARSLAQKAPGDLNHVFFTSDGSSAVDTAVRFIQFRNNIMGKPDKKIVISREKAYHGSSFLSASLCGKERDKGWMDQVPGLAHFLPDVNPYRRSEGQSVAAFLTEKLADLENAILKLGADKVAAFIAEPILASGGVIVPPPGYHKGCLEICRKFDVLYISDEVVTGFGRLGHWFASQSEFGITPDIITCAKGLTSGYVPMGAAIISDRLLDDVKNYDGPDASFSNGYTYSGHPVSAAVALKNIEIIENEGILEHVRALAPYFQQRLNSLSDLPLVVNTRGVGLMGCVECSLGRGDAESLEQDKTIGARIDAHCQELGLLVRPLINCCVFSPPLIISQAEVDMMFDRLEIGIRKTAAEFGR